MLPILRPALLAALLLFTSSPDEPTVQGGDAPVAGDDKPATAVVDSAVGEPFALVELFTSQGCSSCPPADELLSKLVDEAEGGRLFPIAFHVDYWNRLGWTDPFSDAAFSARQRAYAQALGLRSVYTPQAVVNGRFDVVGSRETRVREAIAEAMKDSLVGRVRLERRVVGDDLIVAYAIDGIDEGMLVNVALVERGLEVKVGRGENAGRRLHHENVVRRFAAAEALPGNAGELELAIPERLDRSRASIVAWVQHPRTMRVVAAERIGL